MLGKNASRDSKNPATFWCLWCVFFVYATVVAFVVQFVLLPHLFPEWHVGHGLLVGGDSLAHHRVAVQLAKEIRTQGWNAWVLRPSGQAPAGIASAVYALTVAEPWVLIPLHAALHATAGLVLLRIVQFFIPDWRLAIWAVLPFVFSPSAMLWYTQILKDGYSIAGSFLLIYGWMSLARLETWQRIRWLPLQPILWIVLGAVLAWIVRPYMIVMIQGVVIGLALLLTAVFLVRVVRAQLPWRKAVVGAMLVWAMVLVLSPPPRFLGWMASKTAPASETAPAPAPASETALTKDSWQATTGVPRLLENRLYTLTVLRNRFRRSYPDAASNIDTDIGFRSALDTIAYLPRAAQIAFLTPFPSHWFGEGSLEVNTVKRRISGLEMMGVYFALAFLPYTIWRWRRRIEVWVVVIFSTSIMLLYGLTVPNVGTLYRRRYGFLMILVALGAAGCLTAWQSFHQGRQHGY